MLRPIVILITHLIKGPEFVWELWVWVTSFLAKLNFKHKKEKKKLLFNSKSKVSTINIERWLVNFIRIQLYYNMEGSSDYVGSSMYYAPMQNMLINIYSEWKIYTSAFSMLVAQANSHLYLYRSLINFITLCHFCLIMSRVKWECVIAIHVCHVCCTSVDSPCAAWSVCEAELFHKYPLLACSCHQWNKSVFWYQEVQNYDLSKKKRRRKD